MGLLFAQVTFLPILPCRSRCLCAGKLSPGDEIITVENESIQETKMSKDRVKALFMVAPP